MKKNLRKHLMYSASAAALISTFAGAAGTGITAMAANDSQASSQQTPADAQAMTNLKNALAQAKEIREEIKNPIVLDYPGLPKKFTLGESAENLKNFDAMIKAGDGIIDKGTVSTETVQTAIDGLTKATKTMQNNLTQRQKKVSEIKQSYPRMAQDQATAKKDLQDAINKAKKIKDSDTYKKAPQDDKDSFDKALDHAEDINNKTNPTITEMHDAIKGLEKAEQGLIDGKKDVDEAKKNLQDAINKGQALENTDAFKNADPKDQQALKDAIKKAQDVLNDPNATLKDVTDAIQGITDAANKINGPKSDAKKDLADAINDAEQIKKTDRYKNSTPKEKEAFDKALDHAKTVLNDPYATSESIENAIKGLQEAENGLTGNQDKTQVKKDLQDALNKAKQMKNSDVYKNASKDAQNALDQAIKNAENVLNNPNATKADYQSALDQLNGAMTGLQNSSNSQNTDYQNAKKNLQDEINKADQIKNSDTYKNASPEAKAAFDKALENAKAVLANPNSTLADLQNALTALKAAEDGLTASNKTAQDDKNGVTANKDKNGKNGKKSDATGKKNKTASARKHAKKDNASYPDAASYPKHLPQTGEKVGSALGIAGLALASITAALGGGVVAKRKHNN